MLRRSQKLEILIPILPLRRERSNFFPHKNKRSLLKQLMIYFTFKINYYLISLGNNCEIIEEENFEKYLKSVFRYILKKKKTTEDSHMSHLYRTTFMPMLIMTNKNVLRLLCQRNTNAGIFKETTTY